MAAAGGAGPWEFLSTHPSYATRRAKLQEALPEAKLYYADRSRPLPTNLAEARSAALSHSSTMALTPTALQPTFKLGYWYRIKASNRSAPDTIRADRLENCPVGQCVVLARDDGGAMVVKSDYTDILETRGADGSWTRYSPGLPALRFPLRVGDRWAAAVNFENSRGGKGVLQVTADVVAYEQINVPAGQFMAYKVLSAINGIRVREAWYVPEVRASVRIVTYDNKGDRMNTTEILDFQKSDEPAGASAEPRN